MISKQKRRRCLRNCQYRKYWRCTRHKPCAPKIIRESYLEGRIIGQVFSAVYGVLTTARISGLMPSTSYGVPQSIAIIL